MSSSNSNPNHGILKFIVILIIMIAVLFLTVTLVEFKLYDCSGSTQSNTDGSSKLLSRSARNSDINIDTDLDLSSFGCKFTVTPQVDISNLEITIKFLDEDKSVLYTTEKSLGNVKESVQVSFSISLFDLGLSVAWNTQYTSCSVTGGTVSYFS